MTCLYCNIEYSKNTDHVFPSGLGGEDIFIDCVCLSCNNKFSDLEGHLLQKSPIGMIRVIEGVKLEGKKTLAFKAPVLIHLDEKTGIVYEFAEHGVADFFIRPQIILKNENFYIEASDELSRQNFANVFQRWLKTNLRVITSAPRAKGSEMEFLQFEKKDMGFEFILKSEYLKVKDEIRIDILRRNHELYSHLEPRLFIDDDARLRIRARSIAEATDFINKFLNRILSATPLTSYGPEKVIKNPAISVGLGFDVVKLERALVKIIVNCIAHFYKGVRMHSSLKDWIEFVNNGNHTVTSPFKKPKLSLKSPKDTHMILISQVGKDAVVNLHLFNDALCYELVLQGLQLLTNFEHNRLMVKFKERKIIFQGYQEFLSSLH